MWDIIMPIYWLVAAVYAIGVAKPGVLRRLMVGLLWPAILLTQIARLMR